MTYGRLTHHLAPHPRTHPLDPVPRSRIRNRRCCPARTRTARTARTAVQSVLISQLRTGAIEPGYDLVV